MKKLESRKCVLLNGRNGTGQGVVVGERTTTKIARRRWAAELKTAKPEQKRKYLLNDAPVKMQTGILASKYPFFLDFWTQLSAKKLVNNVDIKMVEYKISVFTLYFTKSLLSSIPVRWVLDSPGGKIKAHVLKHCAHNEWKLLILTFPHFSLVYLIIPSSPLTEIVWKQMRHSRTTVVGIHYGNNHLVFRREFQ